MHKYFLFFFVDIGFFVIYYTELLKMHRIIVTNTFSNGISYYSTENQIKLHFLQFVDEHFTYK